MTRLAVFVVCVALLGCLPPAQKGPEERRFKDGKDANALLEGKTPDEVIKAIGRPDDTRGDAWKDEYAEWTYSNRLFNRARDRYCDDIKVLFRGGKVERAH